MSNHLPGRAHLSSDELMVAEMKKTKTYKHLFSCYLHPRKFYQNTMRLNKKKECQMFFSIVKKKTFARKMKTQIMYNLKNLDSDYETNLDFFELQKLMSIYKSGELCGKIKQKYLLRNYIWNQAKYRNGHKFKIRAFMVVLSTTPMYVVFNRGYTILDRFNNSISFTDASISHEELFEFLKTDRQTSKTRFNYIFDEIKQASSLLFEMSYRKFLRDPRYFQVFAMDFVLDSRLTPYLVDVKGAPDYTHKNQKFVSDLLEIIQKMNQDRGQRMMNLINTLKHQINQKIRNKDLQAQYWSKFIPEIKKIISSGMKEIKNLKTNSLPSLKTLKEAEMEVIFNEKRKGKAKGDIPENCL